MPPCPRGYAAHPVAAGVWPKMPRTCARPRGVALARAVPGRLGSLVPFPDGLAEVAAAPVPSRSQGIASHPHTEALHQEFPAAVDRSEGIWRETYDDGSWHSEDERGNHLADHMHEARQEATPDRAVRAGRLLMELCDHLAETVWPEVTDDLRETALERVARALKEATMAGGASMSFVKPELVMRWLLRGCVVRRRCRRGAWRRAR